MKATGIVRRIDDLGRVVIPKEIRRTMRIREGDPLEIYTDRDGEVIFKKYSLMGGLGDFAADICETMTKTTGFVAAIADRDSILAAAGAPKRELCDRRVSAELEGLMEARQLYRRGPEDPPILLVEDNGKYRVAVAAPILSQGDVMGCVLFAAQDGDAAQPGETEAKLVQTVSGFLGRHMES